MATPTKSLGFMRPLGGGDPIPLLKEELVIGRRPTCDICLDFENISGKHCSLKFIKGVWHIRDLHSTNGTFVNHQRADHDHGVMPEDELRIATHVFSLDYEPMAPTSLIDANIVLGEEIAEASRRDPSLMELAGLEGESESRPRRARPKRPADRPEPSRLIDEFEKRASESESRQSAPTEYTPENIEGPEGTDQDFLNLIQDDLKRDDD